MNEILNNILKFTGFTGTIIIGLLSLVGIWQYHWIYLVISFLLGIYGQFIAPKLEGKREASKEISKKRDIEKEEIEQEKLNDQRLKKKKLNSIKRIYNSFDEETKKWLDECKNDRIVRLDVVGQQKFYNIATAHKIIKWKGQYLGFMSTLTIPFDEDWLEFLIKKGKQ